MAQLRALHRSAGQRAQSAAITVGVIGTLILGSGMSLAMTDLGTVFGLSGSFAMVLGGFGWESSVGMLLRPVFRLFWREIGKLRDLLALPVKKFWKRTKILIASSKKWVTIKWSNRRHNLSKFGGKYHGKIQRIRRKDPAGQNKQRETDDCDDRGGHRIVYGCVDRPALFNEQPEKPHRGSVRAGRGAGGPTGGPIVPAWKCRRPERPRGDSHPQRPCLRP